MSDTRNRPTVIQLSMTGMPAPVYTRANVYANRSSVAPGQEVLFLGKVSGGPRYGSHGVVKQALRRKAVVDMGLSGTWHVPYYFLALPQAA